MIRLACAAAAVLMATAGLAQLVSPLQLPTVDTSSLATKAEVTAVQAAMPQPANALPPSEAVGGLLGSSTRYRRMDDVPPRLTRATTVTTIAGGSFSGTWTTALPNAPSIVLTPIAASASIDCQLTAAPTTTTFAGRCWTAQNTLLNLSIITAGLTLAPAANTAAGISVQVVAIPFTQ